MVRETGDRRLESGGRTPEGERLKAVGRRLEEEGREKEEHLKEVATILARGYLRMKRRNASLANLENSVQPTLPRKEPDGSPGFPEDPDVHGSEPPSPACEESSPRGEKGPDSSNTRSSHWVERKNR